MADAFQGKGHVLENTDDVMGSGKCILVPQYLCYNIVHFAVIMVGYVQTAVSIPESARVAQLTVVISVPPQADRIETSFFLLVNMNDGTAAGLSSCLEFDLHTVHTSLPLSH